MPIDNWCQMVIKHTDADADIITSAPETGIYRMNKDGVVEFDRFDYHRRAVSSEEEAFYLRIMTTGDVRYSGGDLGILVTRGDAMGKGSGMRKRAKQWVSGIKALYTAQPLTTAHAEPTGPVLTKMS